MYYLFSAVTANELTEYAIAKGQRAIAVKGGLTKGKLAQNHLLFFGTLRKGILSFS